MPKGRTPPRDEIVRRSVLLTHNYAHHMLCGSTIGEAISLDVRASRAPHPPRPRSGASVGCESARPGDALARARATAHRSPQPRLGRAQAHLLARPRSGRISEPRWVMWPLSP